MPADAPVMSAVWPWPLRVSVMGGLYGRSYSLSHASPEGAGQRHQGQQPDEGDHDDHDDDVRVVEALVGYNERGGNVALRRGQAEDGSHVPRRAGKQPAGG